MPRAIPRPCPHDLRPGTAICLHCRREAKLEARARLHRRLFRIATFASAVAVIGVAVALVGMHGPEILPLRVALLHAAPRIVAAPHRPAPVAVVATADTMRTPMATATAMVTTVVPPAASPAALTAAAAATPTSSATTPTAAAPQTAPPTVTPVIPEGRHDIDSAIFAERVGDTVVVHFDTPMTRTRMPEKFEHTVRLSLPAVYGPVGDSMLAAVPQGTLTSGGDLLKDLPTRGIRLTAPNGAAVMLWPETRPGEDGPLVVTYRVAPAR